MNVQSDEGDKPVSANVIQSQMDGDVLQIVERLDKFVQTSSRIGRYKVYPTTNTYTSLRLDTATGQVSALQIGIGKEAKTMSYEITDALYVDEEIIGRYELYPTNNVRNFILLDTIKGYAYQIQWSTKEEECGRWLMR